jgi:N-hydroxyarylamine O-acetyltransferase
MAFDFAPYLQRIEYAGALSPTLETLRELQFAHVQRIPFENLDVLLGRPILLDHESIWNKLVVNCRGGYCFEQNRLFATVLENLGFQVTCLAGRVQMGAQKIRPRTHMLLMIRVSGEDWLADVGFGGESLFYPLRFKVDEVQSQFGWQYRIASERDCYTLQSMRPEGWFDLYRFTLEPRHPIDYEVANHYTSTYSQSRFIQNLIVARPSPAERVSLWNRTLLIQTPSGTTETLVEDDEELLQLLEERFGLRFPAGTKFPQSNSTEKYFRD